MPCAATWMAASRLVCKTPHSALLPGSGVHFPSVPGGPKLVQANLPGFVGVGHLYKLGDQHFLVYTGAARDLWDVSAADPRTMRFGATLVRAARSREEALRRLVEVLEAGG